MRAVERVAPRRLSSGGCWPTDCTSSPDCRSSFTSPPRRRRSSPRRRGARARAWPRCAPTPSTTRARRRRSGASCSPRCARTAGRCPTCDRSRWAARPFPPRSWTTCAGRSRGPASPRSMPPTSREARARCATTGPACRSRRWARTTTRVVAHKVVEGELWVRSRIGMLGYYGEPAVDPDAWRPTGDLVEVVDDRIVFRGRSSDIINVGGVKVHPLPIEDRIASGRRRRARPRVRAAQRADRRDRRGRGRRAPRMRTPRRSTPRSATRAPTCPPRPGRAASGSSRRSR